MTALTTWLAKILDGRKATRLVVRQSDGPREHADVHTIELSATSSLGAIDAEISTAVENDAAELVGVQKYLVLAFAGDDRKAIGRQLVSAEGGGDPGDTREITRTPQLTTRLMGLVERSQQTSVGALGTIVKAMSEENARLHGEVIRITIQRDGAEERLRAMRLEERKVEADEVSQRAQARQWERVGGMLMATGPIVATKLLSGKGGANKADPAAQAAFAMLIRQFRSSIGQPPAPPTQLQMIMSALTFEQQMMLAEIMKYAGEDAGEQPPASPPADVTPPAANGAAH